MPTQAKTKTNSAPKKRIVIYTKKDAKKYYQETKKVYISGKYVKDIFIFTDGTYTYGNIKNIIENKGLMGYTENESSKTIDLLLNGKTITLKKDDHYITVKSGTAGSGFDYKIHSVPIYGTPNNKSKKMYWYAPLKSIAYYLYIPYKETDNAIYINMDNMNDNDDESIENKKTNIGEKNKIFSLFKEVMPLEVHTT